MKDEEQKIGTSIAEEKDLTTKTDTMKAMSMDKWTPKQRKDMNKNMVVAYVLQFVASLVMFYVLAGWIIGFNHMTVMGGVETAFIAWIGFVVPLALGNAIWGGKMKIFWLNIGNMLVTLVVAGMIIGAWA